MPYYPIWALTYIAVGMFVVYGLAAYGGRDDVDMDGVSTGRRSATAGTL